MMMSVMIIAMMKITAIGTATMTPISKEFSDTLSGAMDGVGVTVEST